FGPPAVVKVKLVGSPLGFVILSTVIDPRRTLVNVHVTVSPTPSVIDARGDALVSNELDPEPVVVTAQLRPVKSQPVGTVSATVRAPGVKLLNDTLPVPPVVVMSKLAGTPDPLTEKLNAASPPVVVFCTISVAGANSPKLLSVPFTFTPSVML